MNDLSKIQALINSKSKENNYIAICLMIEVLGWTFEEAFARLPLSEESPEHFVIEIAEIKILYEVEFSATVDFPSTWATICRYIYLGNNNIKEFYRSVFIHEEELQEENAINSHLLHDLKAITPIIKKIFEQKQIDQSTKDI